MNKFMKETTWGLVFLSFVLIYIMPLFSYAQQFSNQPNIPRPSLHKLNRPQTLIQRLLSQQAQDTKTQTLVDSKPKCPKCDKLLEKAYKHGLVTVIIGFNINVKPEHTLTNEAAQAQREAITTAQEKLLKRMANQKVTSVKRFELSPGMSMTVDEAGLKALMTDPEVSRIGEDQLRDFMLPQSVPLIGADQSWASGFTGTGYTIAIVDSGVDNSHPFFTNKVVAEACFSTNTTEISPYDGMPYAVTSLCPNGLSEQIGVGAGVNCNIYGCTHGTRVAGIAAGNGTNFTNFSGVAKDANIIAIQIASGVEGSSICFPNPAPCAKVYDSDVIRALNYIYSLRNSNNIAAVNLSLGGGRYAAVCDNDPDFIDYKAAIDALRSAGIATIAASGNNGCGATGGCSNEIASPACISTTISVGATTKSDTVPSYSNSASFLNLLAPGGDGSKGIGDIYSSIPLGGFDYMGGTSLAAPHVAGAFAVLKQQSPTATPDDILSILQSYGVQVLDTRNNITKPRIDLANTPWIVRYSADPYESKIAVDSYGNTYITALGGQGFTTIKYDTHGNQIWVRYFNGGNVSCPVDIASDSLGNIIVTGLVNISEGIYNTVTIKYNADGDPLWIASKDNSIPSGISVDANDNVSVAMSTTDS